MRAVRWLVLAFAALIAFCSGCSRSDPGPAATPPDWIHSFVFNRPIDRGAESSAVDALGKSRVFAYVNDTVVAIDATDGHIDWKRRGIRGIAPIADVAAVLEGAGADIVAASTGLVKQHAGLARGATSIVAQESYIATLSGCHLTVFDRKSEKLKAYTIALRRCSGLTDIGSGFVFIDEPFSGAWMGVSKHAIELSDGAERWSVTDADVVASSNDTVTLSPLSSAVPWALPGTLSVRRLRDGSILSPAPPGEREPGDQGLTIGNDVFLRSSNEIRRFGPRDPKDGLLIFAGGEKCSLNWPLYRVGASLFFVCSRHFDTGEIPLRFGYRYENEWRATGADAAPLPQGVIYATSDPAADRPVVRAIAAFPDRTEVAQSPPSLIVGAFDDAFYVALPEGLGVWSSDGALRRRVAVDCEGSLSVFRVANERVAACTDSSKLTVFGLPATLTL